jgi:hypothetical protein
VAAVLVLPVVVLFSLVVIAYCSLVFAGCYCLLLVVTVDIVIDIIGSFFVAGWLLLLDIVTSRCLSKFNFLLLLFVIV